MKGVNYILNERNEKIAVQIDIKTIVKHQQEIEDLLDGILAESRKEEEKVSLSDVLGKLKKF